MENTGFFTISLDFELYWGIRDSVNLKTYKENIENVHHVIPQILNLFSKYNIHATWCIVGFLFFDNKDQLLKNLPDKIPLYTDKRFDQYNYISKHELKSIYHFAPESIKLIRQTNNQEIGTHTFSHYFCLEKGQHPDEFKCDIQKAIDILNNWNIDCKSIIFPRNQYDERYLVIAKNAGIKYYRGNEKFWTYQYRELRFETRWKRFFRLLDAYINISGYNTFYPERMNESLPMNVPSSGFLRPYNSALQFAENLRFRRIANAMTFAAKNNQGYHLWWHPHNFGKNINKNLNFLQRILEHYTVLNHKYGFQSKAMCEY